MHEKLLSGLVDQAQAHAKGMSPQALANTLWSFAKMEYNPGIEVTSAMANLAGEKMDEFNGETTCDRCKGENGGLRWVEMDMERYWGWDWGWHRDS